ncbi:hypothetical protein [Halospeciosus flavus]|uniref:hypothetical protein n=1 Tax=Halospeciosus flavus TaxID=3032283 RepID=UPI00361B6BA8
MIDDPRYENAVASASGSSGTVMVACGRSWGERAPTKIRVGSSNSSRGVLPNSPKVGWTPVNDASGTRTYAFGDGESST